MRRSVSHGDYLKTYWISRGVETGDRRSIDESGAVSMAFDSYLFVVQECEDYPLLKRL